MENKNIDEKIDAALSSLDGMERAEADDALFERVLHQLNEKKIKARSIVPMRTVWLAAASFALIVALNVSFLLKNAKNGPPTEGVHSTAAMAIAQSYFNVNH